VSGTRHFSRLTQGFRAKLRCRVGVAAFSRHDAPAVLLTTVGTGQTKWEFSEVFLGAEEGKIK
jgi:hypothetical protein